jgi:hypothetical protein
MSSVFISRPLDLVLVNALILIRRDLGMVEVVCGGGVKVSEGGSVGCGKIPQDDFLANRCKKGGLDLLEEATSNWARSSNKSRGRGPSLKIIV